MRIDRNIIPLFLMACCLGIVNKSVAQTGIVRGKIKSDTEVLAAATVSLHTQTVLSDEKGEFTFSIQPGKFMLVISYAGYRTIEKEIIVSAGSIQSFEFILGPSSEMDKVIILGSRSLKQRSKLHTPVPVDIIQFSRLPVRQAELSKIIENTIPSFYAAPHGFREGKQSVPVSLRSLGPDHTLVLLHGRRRHTMASPWTFGVVGFGTVGVDLNAIPSAAMETAEILRDGASAQYGSDAIAGVINLQLKRSTGKTILELHAGQHYKGDGEAISFSINRGITFLKKGFLNFTAQSRFNNYTQRNGIYDSTVYFRILPGANSAQKDSIRALDNKKIAERGFDRKNHRPVGDNRVWNTGFVINGGYPLSKRTFMDWTAIWNTRNAKDRSSNIYRYPRDSATQVNIQLHPDGFLPQINSKVPDFSLMSGINGFSHSGWRWDAGLAFGKSSGTVNVSNSNNASQYLSGRNAQTEFYTGKQIFSQLTGNVNVRRNLLYTAKGLPSLHISFGAEFRNEHYQIKEGEEASWKNYLPVSGRFGGSQGQAGFQPMNAINKNRQVAGGYAEFEFDQNEKLLMNLAGRFENYSDYGNSVAGKFAFRYRFSDLLTWRSSISNGFRAPALQQRFYSLVTTTTRPGGVVLRTVTFTNDSREAKEFGIPGLDAEKSINVSTGLTSSISGKLSITIDAYWIQIKDRIIYSGNIPDSPEVRSILNKLGYYDIQNVRFFSNAVNTRTKGIDLVITGHWSSKLTTTLSANFNQTEIYGATLYAKNLPDNDIYRNILVNREERCRIEDAYPSDKIILTIAYHTGKWRFHSVFARYGKVSQKGNNPKEAPDEIFTPRIITSMNLRYQLTGWIAITAGAENLTDLYPDKLVHRSNTLSGLLPYNPNFSVFGVNGGFYFLNMSFSLK